MQLPEHFRRFPVAFLVSIALNVILFAVDFSIDPRQEKLSRIEHLVVVLLTPADALTTWLAPGHGGAQIFDLVLFSLAIYTIVSWVAISLPAWWRRRG
jgi:hypothetical protein